MGITLEMEKINKEKRREGEGERGREKLEKDERNGRKMTDMGHPHSFVSLSILSM